MRMHVYAQHDAPLCRWGIVAARASLSCPPVRTCLYMLGYDKKYVKPCEG